MILPHVDVIRKQGETTDIAGMTVCVWAGLVSRLKITLRLLGFHPAQVKPM